MTLPRVLGVFAVFGAIVVSCSGDDEARKPGPGSGGQGGSGGSSAGKGGSMGKSGSGGAGGVAGKGGSGGAAGATSVAGEGGVAGESGAAGEGGGASGEAGATGNGGASGEAGSAGDGGASGQGGSGGDEGTPVFTTDLDGQSLPPELTPGTGTLTPSQGFAPLGTPGNIFGPTFLRSPTNNVVTLTLTNLPPHTSLSLDLLFAAIDSLDGTGTFPAGDFFRVTLDGQDIFRESFANAIETQIQSYVPPPGVELARRVDLGFQGPGGYYTDSAYDFSKDPSFDDIPHTASSAVLVFALEGEGIQDLLDESWAIDNLSVTVK